MTLPIATETIVALYQNDQMSAPQIAAKLGCSPETVAYRLRKTGISLRRTNKRYLRDRLKPHMPVLLTLIGDKRKERKALAEFVVDPRSPDSERKKAAEKLVKINAEVKALEIVVSK